MTIILFFTVTLTANALEKEEGAAEHFSWWPTDAAPGLVKDEERGGCWWWPTTPGEIIPWGNRGYIYRIIFDYKEEELPLPKPKEPRPFLLIKRTMKNVKICFDFDKAELRDEAMPILENAVKVLNRNPVEANLQHQ